MMYPRILYFSLFLVFLAQSLSAQTTLPVSRDNQLHDINNNNSPTHPSIMAKMSPNGSNDPIQRSLIDFNFSCFPESTVVDSARLYLFHALTTAGNSHEGFNQCVLQRITTAWDETAVTWTTQPPTTSVNEAVVPIQSAGANLSLLITPLVQDMLNRPVNDRHGMLFKLETELPTRRQAYASSDHADSTLHPYLVLYTSPSGTAVTTQGDSLIASTGSGSATYQWLDCNNNFQPISGATNQVFQPQVSGSYAVEIYENGCIYRSACTQITITGRAELEERFADFVVFPNPTSGEFTISWEHPVPRAKGVISNILGEHIQGVEVVHQSRINFELQQPPGFYFLQVALPDGSYKTVRVVKK